MDHPHDATGAGVSLVRALNEQRVLDTVLSRGRVSRADIVRETGLSKPTVSSVVSDLEDCGLLQPDGESAGSVGRPALLYRVNPQAGYVYAADIGGTKIRAGIADLFGEILSETTTATPADMSGPSLVAEIKDVLDGLRTDAGLTASQIRAAGVGVPGIVDIRTGRVSGAYNLPGLEAIDVSRSFSDGLGVPVHVDNDVNLAAVGERWRGLAAEHDTFVAISIGTGVGMGVIIDGEIFRGAHGAAGEIDFLPLGPDPYGWPSHGHGPFEAQAAAPAVLGKFQHRYQRDSTRLPADADLPAIFAAATAGDEFAQSLLDEEARYLALAIAAVSATLDPALVVLGGGVGSNKDLCAVVRTHVNQLTPRPPHIEVSALGARGAFVGAIAVALPIVRSQLLAEVAATR